MFTSVTFWEVAAPAKLSFCLVKIQFIIFQSLYYIKQFFIVIILLRVYIMQDKEHKADNSKGTQGLSVQLYLDASSRLIQFHKNNIRDSRAVVTPFVQDGTYPSRDFATLGPSGLRPPFTGVYIATYIAIFRLTALGRCQTLYIIFLFSKVLCF